MALRNSFLEVFHIATFLSFVKWCYPYAWLSYIASLGGSLKRAKIHEEKSQ